MTTEDKGTQILRVRAARNAGEAYLADHRPSSSWYVIKYLTAALSIALDALTTDAA